MTVDVFGMNPTSRHGGYHRGGPAWGSLTAYLRAAHPALTRACAWGVGAALDGERAVALAAALRRDVDGGVVRRFLRERVRRGD